ncbi:hypothetical protein BN1723_003985 [Verticillium longisporum]|uniref:MYND-type domain-containing protein n=3 Tax=Verticillium TaxID=1036719 RepID=G2WRS6_VERDV|nr:uncharacterized protein VDAG_00259 [Verticillium dahliae VdLs.17]KAG7114200.1 hypothetical protein HYQ44_008902 [Verticillium longisporum]KAH6710029.1 hypothetical protein EV126DRAFT_514634 [Verticillium dahliae]EGY13577.1 hypothetical protein VDAG_00259 [Verticillium dahliae VdLs.17]PNH34357.1 hypothetical protein BJF96_g2600 [Verticillium dahliae]PNH47022.1 hypothetical protein VD0004_g1180 [Verticillium dahliae]
MPLPDFTSPAVFPAFANLPLGSNIPPPPSKTSNDPPPYAPGDAPDASAPPTYTPVPATTTHFLLAEVKQNMTITKPTLIATDRAGADFAITFEDRGIDLRPVKSGWTVVVPGATRTSPAEGKRGFVRVGEGRGTGVHYLPAGLERVLDLGRQLGEAARGGEAAVCAGCEKEETEGDALMRCTGCGRARYCSKVCQKKDWGEGGHKVDCKVFKAMAVTWGA